MSLGITNVEVDFSKLLEAVSATNVANYVLTNGAIISSALLLANGTTVILTTARWFMAAITRSPSMVSAIKPSAKHHCREHAG